ncbi:UDP-D-apiose/UDP-D-xylose synthase-like isoform X1 [Rhododendron vialii]|uniref:UDP-D-apiose/UDP-D-xylose synthase-like isoform X1 n=1 Tax=Rhododendron vialii TaxID=182163 RepID=UPI00265DABB9|nr:UDP-D-apiose/UDP-D-xylose synthase-like isoform X1 [Rhododendron vialii]
MISGSRELSTINLAAICTPADYNTRPLDTIYSNFIDALPVVKYCSENNKCLIHLSTCEVYGKTIGSFLPTDHPMRQVRLHFVLCLCKDQNLVLFNTPGTLWCPFCVFIFNYEVAW